MHSTQAMVYAICHEVGNLLAAIRLHGELLDPDSGRQIAELSARSGSLLSLVRPLLEDSTLDAMAIEPGRLLEGVRRALDDPADPRLVLESAAAAQLPSVLVDGEVLHHLLLCELLAAFEQLEPGERLRVALRKRAEWIVFELTGGMPERAPAAGDRLAGRSLSHALAAELLARVGGGVHAGARDGRRHVELTIPLA